MFNIRVYGILVNENHQVLVSDELIRGQYITKFCGGGLEKGEGTIQGLAREFMEEMQLHVQVTGHLYTTDFYQQSAFNAEHQIISIYYTVRALAPIEVPIRTEKFQFDETQMQVYEHTGETETFRFIDWADFSEESVSLPIDKVVAGMVKKHGPLFRHELLVENSVRNAGDPSATFFTKDIILQNNRARLEPLSEEHFAPLWHIAKHAALWEFTSVTIHTEDDFRKYFQQALDERATGTSYPFAIFDLRENRYGGCTRFGNISFQHKRLEIGWTWYDPSLQRSGLNRNCKFLLLGYAFETLNFNRVELKTSALNLRSQRAMEDIGAQKEGVLRRHMINESGTVRDSVYYSFIKEEWPATRERIFKGYDQSQEPA
jgi:RimJ/RimL family protein N-acetyltransferase/8-oxo-dGTP pyrophosphatase MutT (NUDIX family)